MAVSDVGEESVDGVEAMTMALIRVLPCRLALPCGRGGDVDIPLFFSLGFAFAMIFNLVSAFSFLPGLFLYSSSRSRLTSSWCSEFPHHHHVCFL